MKFPLTNGKTLTMKRNIVCWYIHWFMFSELFSGTERLGIYLRRLSCTRHVSRMGKMRKA